MSSHSFPAKYDGMNCVICHQAILIGSMIRFARKGSKDLEHETCPHSTPPSPEASSKGREGSPVPRTTTPTGPVDPAIYTHHLTLKVWRNGLQVGEIMEGVSHRGQEISDVERAGVSDAVKRRARFNELGEVWK